MLKYLIALLVVLFSTTGVQAAEGSDRAALSDAWRRYSELIAEGDYEASLVEARRVLDLAETLFPENDRQLAAATVNYGENLLDVGRLDEAANILRVALRRYESLHGNNSPELIDVLLSMAAAGASPPDYRPQQQFLDRAHRIAAENFDDSSIEYADTLLSIVEASYFYPPSAATGDSIRKSLEIYRAQTNSSVYQISYALAQLGIYHARRGEYGDAERLLREALDVHDPSNDELQSLCAAVDQFLNAMLDELGSREAEIASLATYQKMHESNPDFDNSLPIVRVAPVYPAAALRAGRSGYVDFLLTVDEQGFVINPQIVDSTGHESFQKAALGAVMKFRYVPRYVDGQAVAVQGVRTRISFELQN